MNLILIPIWGPLGAAAASLISTLVLLSAGWLVARQLVRLDNKFLSQRLGAIMIAGLIMLVLAWWLKYYIHFLAVVPVAGVVYTALLLGLGGVTRQEIKELTRVILKRQPVQ